MDSNEESLWTVKEAGEYLGLSSAAIYRLRRFEGLPAITMRGTIRFRPAAVREWALAQESASGHKVKLGRPVRRQPARRRQRVAV